MGRTLAASRVHNGNPEKTQVKVGVVDDFSVPGSLNQRQQHASDAFQFVGGPVAGHGYVVICSRPNVLKVPRHEAERRSHHHLVTPG